MTFPRVVPLRTPGRAPRVLTVDVEEWFHVCGEDYYSDPRRWSSFPSRIEANLLRIFDLLSPGRHRATFFFLGWVAERRPDLVREAVRRGHEIGVHGYFHRRADEAPPERFREDLLRARDRIEEAGGVPAGVHRAAEWSIRRPDDPALAVLAAEGFVCDASMTPVPPLGDASNYAGPQRITSGDRSIVEIPPLTGAGFGRALPMGGGWPFRFFSAERIGEAEERFRGAGWPAVFTFHPWELDDSHPPMEGLPPLLRLVHFFNLGSTGSRLRSWLEADRCVAIGDVLSGLAA